MHFLYDFLSKFAFVQKCYVEDLQFVFIHFSKCLSSLNWHETASYVSGSHVLFYNYKEVLVYQNIPATKGVSLAL